MKKTFVKTGISAFGLAIVGCTTTYQTSSSSYLQANNNVRQLTKENSLTKIEIPLKGQNSFSIKGFDFGDGTSGGSGSFNEYIPQNGRAVIGSIPSGIKNLRVSLKALQDLDIELWNGNTLVVGWNADGKSGLITSGSKVTGTYNGDTITWSGWNGDGTGLGNEYIEINGTTKNNYVMKAFGYQAGTSGVNYSWEGNGGIKESGSGNFEQYIPRNGRAEIGVIPVGVNNLQVNLKAQNDLDIELWSGNTFVVGWKGAIDSYANITGNYNGDTITWSGYNGDGTGLGNEYIKITAKNKNTYTMKAYGYQDGTAKVNYSWGNTGCGFSTKANGDFEICTAPIEYNANIAIDYALKNINKSYKSGNKENPFSDYGYLKDGGNCTNFASQVIMAGLSKTSDINTIFNSRYEYKADMGASLSAKKWYFISDGSRGDAWAGANNLYEYAKSSNPEYKGLYFESITYDDLSKPGQTVKSLELGKIKVGDIVFANWNANEDNTIDHSMVVTETHIGSWNYSGYNEIRVSYQGRDQDGDPRVNKGLGDINNPQKTRFFVYRPSFYRKDGKNF